MLDARFSTLQLAVDRDCIITSTPFFRCSIRARSQLERARAIRLCHARISNKSNFIIGSPACSTRTFTAVYYPQTKLFPRHLRSTPVTRTRPSKPVSVPTEEDCVVSFIFIQESVRGFVMNGQFTGEDVTVSLNSGFPGRWMMGVGCHAPTPPKQGYHKAR